MASVADIFRGAYVALFTVIFILIFASLDPAIITKLPDVLNILQFLVFIMQQILLLAVTIAITIAYSIYSGITGIAYSLVGIAGIGTIVTLITGIQPTGGGTADQAKVGQLRSWIITLINEIFPHPTLAANKLATVIEDFINVLAFLAIGIAIAIALFTFIGFVTSGKAQLAITSFLSLQVIVIMAMYIRRLNINLSIPDSPFDNPVQTNPIILIFEALIDLITAPVFLLGLMLYLMLEFSFQSSYAMNIIDPMVARGRRITEHLKRVMTYVPSKAEEKKGTTQAMSSAMQKKYGLLAASYIKEMINKRMFKRKKDELDPKSMMRLQGFIGQISRKDPHFKEQVTAMSAAAKSKTVMLYFLPLLIIRVVIVVFLSFIILNPSIIIDPLSSIGFSGFNPLLDSFELYQPEFRTAFLFNIALFFIAAGYLTHLRYTKKEREKAVVERVETIVEFDRAGVEEQEWDEEVGDETERDAGIT
ncbi:MAG: hypothetical protein ACFFD4_11730 [Candidatus Odinarchaeota archaeon]